VASDPADDALVGPQVRNRELEKEAQMPRKFDEVGQTGAAAGGRAAAVLAQPVGLALGVKLILTPPCTFH
jgi:hypothetical protein